MAAIQRVERNVIQFIEGFAGWDRGVPVTMITQAATPEEKQAQLKALVARAIAMNAELVEIKHASDRPPIINRPLGAGLYLSTAGRGKITALAAAPGPVGTDVEILDLDAEVPWNVLHPDEVAALKALQGRAQAMAFTRIWSLKESYVKALGVGLKREPSSFAVHFVDGEAARVADPEATADVADARTTWRAVQGVWTAVSTVVLARVRS